MIGLRTHRRDASLCACSGEFRVPCETEIVELVARHLLTGGARPTHAEWTYARWKPGTALTLAHEVGFVDGRACTVVSKLHAGAKLGAPKPYDGLSGELRPYATLAERGLTLSSFPHDRELPALERCLDLRRLARHVDALGLFGPLHMRPGPSKLTTLRYKPERRAVLRLDLRLREQDGAPRQSANLILRVHPEPVAERIARTRRAFDALAPQDLVPRLLAAEERGGLLFEEWLAVEPFAPERFEHARGAGELLARLHALPCPAQPGAARAERFDEWCDVVRDFEGIEQLWNAAPPPRSTWIHGDFHPDQVAACRAGGGQRLLDLDALDVGDPDTDLASWIADHVAALDVDWRDAARPLLEAYVGAGGTPPDERRLGACVARALVRLAAGALRRLQSGASELARQRLATARSIACGGGATAPAVERIDVAKDGAQVLTEDAAGERRWYVLRAGSRSRVTPASDARLPLSRHLPELEREGRVELLAYRPGRRLALRFIADGGPRAILKGYRSGRYALMAQHQRSACAAALGLATRTAKLLELDHEHAALVLDDLGGRPLELGTLQARRLAAFAADLARFQRAPVGGELPEHSGADEVRLVDEWRARAAAAGRSPGTEWDEARRALDAALHALPASPAVLAHRDLHDGQLLDLGGALGWLDFDLLCRADDALDAGNFVAHLELRRLQGVPGLDAARVAELRAAFLSGLERGDDGFARRLAFYEGAACLRLSLVYALRPPWAHLTEPLARRCVELAQRASS